MQSPFYFIVKPLEGKRYNNTKKIGDVNFITSTSEEDFKASNRKAIVEQTPLKYQGPIAKGDTLLVHHNVFKFYNRKFLLFFGCLKCFKVSFVLY